MRKTRGKGVSRSRKDPYGQGVTHVDRFRGTAISFPGQFQQARLMILPGTPHLLTTTVTTGFIAFSLKLDPWADVENFNTRMGNMFVESRLLKAVVSIVPTQPAGQGVSAVFMDEKFSSSPTATETTGKNVKWLINNSNKQNIKTFKWIPNDVDDQEFTVNTAGAASGGSAYFKVFTSNALYNAPIVATSLWLVQAVYYLEARGIQE